MRQLALKNLKGRKAYSAIIILAVTVAVVMALLTLFLTIGARQELENNRQKLGPDMAIVPVGNKEIGNIYMSKGPPPTGVVPVEAFELLAYFPELLAAVSPQKHLGFVDAGGVQTALISFDPQTDFYILPWVDNRNTERFPGRDKGLLLGYRVNADKLPAALPATDAGSASMGGRLLRTGTFMDTAIFIPMPTAAIAKEASWILLKLREGVSPDIAGNRLEVNIERVEVIRSPTLFKVINDQLYRLLAGGGFTAAVYLTIFGALLVTGAMFALMAIERKREFGLLKALGARNAFIFKLVMTEAALLGSAGAVLGIGITAVCLLFVHTGIIFHEIAFALPSGVEALRAMLATAALTLSIAVVMALYPALAASRLEPYAAIRSGE